MGKITENLIIDPSYYNYCSQCKNRINKDGIEVCKAVTFNGNHIKINVIKTCERFIKDKIK